MAKAAAVALRAAQNAGQIFFDIFSRASFFYQKISKLQKINPNIKGSIQKHFERKEPLPKWEVLAENKAVWEQFCQQLRLEVGSLG